MDLLLYFNIYGRISIERCCLTSDLAQLEERFDDRLFSVVIRSCSHSVRLRRTLGGSIESGPTVGGRLEERAMPFVRKMVAPSPWDDFWLHD